MIPSHVVSNDAHLLAVNRHEFGLIMSALIILRRKLAKDLRQSRAKGFIPKPGHINLTEVRNKELALLIERLGVRPKGE